MIARVKSGQASALVSDSTQVVLRAKDDPECSLHVLDDVLGTFDIGFAFRMNFTQEHPGFVGNISRTLLRLNEAGELKVCASRVEASRQTGVACNDSDEVI
jgi:ABC-type amino acid transport substrate-binding protein